MSTQPNEVVAALEVAYKAAREEAAALVRRREILHTELAAVSDQLIKTQQMLNAIRQLLNKQRHSERDDTGAAPTGSREHISVPEARQFRVRKSPEGSSSVEPRIHVTASTPPHARRPKATMYRVVTVLKDAARPLRPAEVLQEFERRNWVDPSWKAPAQSVYSALKRAEEERFASRNEDGLWEIAARGVAIEIPPAVLR